MKPVSLDMSKLLGFRIAQTDASRIGVKLGESKDGFTKAVTAQ